MEPLFWRDKIIAAAIETTYGTDEDPGGADAIYAKEVSLTPMEGNDLDRELELPHFGSQGTIPVELHSKLSLKVELAPSGTAGLAPQWGPLLRACGVAETISAGTSVTYNPITNGAESLTIHFFIGATRHVLKGTRGNARFELTAQGIPHIMFEFTGLFALPSEETRPTPVFTGWQKPQHVTETFTAFTLNAVTTVMRSFTMEMGNAVETRFLVGPESILITDKSEQIECTIQAVPLTRLDPYTLALNATDVALNLRHGVGAGKIATIAVPLAQMQRPQGLQQPQNITEWPLRLVPRTNAGNDQWTLTLT
ncbi:phage tail tube protein [Roseobacter sp. OBYS 0001]|uniref:phage tail tube protein n=1 Tax=Roseobacter sp. OBYS 0001 TaxID=882651 RepID=UPI001BC73B50|nr:phage tail tube protein [Roseobacter sp. OBYS 0001]GIT85405.1 hypothetical protein ROBYS_04210 [Roseobacter sp. OBYS 0001]